MLADVRGSLPVILTIAELITNIKRYSTTNEIIERLVFQVRTWLLYFI
jgi:hypothetical protein